MRTPQNGEALFDFSIMELYAPIELTPNVKVILQGVDPPPPDDKVLLVLLEKSYAFGTGGHPATQGVLGCFCVNSGSVTETGEMAEGRENATAGKRLLDYNCGTGLLGIVIQKAFPKMEVWLAPTLDDWDIAENNNRRNGGDIENLWICDCDETPAELENSFDFVISHGGGQSGIAEMATLLKRGGFLVLGGHDAKLNGDLMHDLMEWASHVQVHDNRGWPVLMGERMSEDEESGDDKTVTTLFGR